MGIHSRYKRITFVGNVVTCRINRDFLNEHGSTRITREAPDFLICDDPWFRPVDLHLGPDGAMYVADFYNRIIGHYEVPLTHPGRDHERGRIWRIVYRGGLGPFQYKPAEVRDWLAAKYGAVKHGAQTAADPAPRASVPASPSSAAASTPLSAPAKSEK